MTPYRARTIGTWDRRTWVARLWETPSGDRWRVQDTSGRGTRHEGGPGFIRNFILPDPSTFAELVCLETDQFSCLLTAGLLLRRPHIPGDGRPQLPRGLLHLDLVETENTVVSCNSQADSSAELDIRT